jgi:3-oxoacyl-[acyl-carrier protein] reductase
MNIHDNIGRNFMKLKGKVAVVTGAGQGIGKAISLAFAKEGASIILNDVNIKKVNKVVKDAIELDVEVVAVKGDISKKKDAKKIIETAIEKFSKIDVLVNNAGITRDALFLKMTEEEWDAVMAVNLKAIFYLTKEALVHMVKRKYGKIINLTSTSGIYGNIGQTNYGASKAGVIGFTLCLAKEMTKHGINVNSICPSFIETPMLYKIPKKVRNRIMSYIKTNAINNRLGQPEDVANAAVFLASDESSYITGEVLKITGGTIW